MLDSLEVTQQVIAILRETLALQPGHALQADTPLLGSIAELDSMAVINVIAALEENFGISMQDDDICAAAFDSIATLSAFVERQLPS